LKYEKEDTNMSTKTEKAIVPAAEAKKPEVKKADIQPLIKVIPDTFTPALLDKLFNLNDGGKTVRRHLRKNFAEAMKHEHKDKWGFTKANVDILQYFADRYAYDLKVLEPAPKTV
jgi:hypothetical protein